MLFKNAVTRFIHPTIRAEHRSSRKHCGRFSKVRLASRLAFATLAMAVHVTAASAKDVERSEDFNVFWPQLREALLSKDLEALDALSLSTAGIPFRYDSLDPSEACHRDALSAYLDAKLDQFHSRPGGASFRELLERTPSLDLSSHTDVGVNALEEYDLALKVRFARNPVDQAWDVVDMLDDLDRVYQLSTSNGGPSSC